MSKDIHLENSISASVDEFDKFQAASMFEEDEYITLSDIVSSPQRNPDNTEIIDDLPGDDDHAEIVQNPKPGTVIPVLSKVNQLLESTRQKSSSEISQSTYKIPKKRGRRKKIVPNEVFLNTNSGLNYDMIIGEESEVEPTVNVISRKNNSIVHNTDSGLNYDMIIGQEIKTEHSLVNVNQQQICTARNTDGDLNYDMIIGEEIELQSTSFNESHKHNETALIASSDLNYHKREEKDVPSSSINNTQEKKRRGRKPKPERAVRKTIKRDQNKNAVPKVQKQPETIKRGRMKKSIDASTLGFFENLDLKHNQANDIKTLTKKKRKKLKKMGDTKKEENKIENINYAKDNLDIDDLEDVPLVAISNKSPVNIKTVDMNKGTELDNDIYLNTSMIPSRTDSNPSGMLPNTSIVSSQVNSNPLVEKNPKKRGRPKKNKVHKPEISINNDNPEKDEISLCKLQDTLEISDNCKDLTNVSKDTKIEVLSNQDNMQNISPNKRNSKKPVMDDYEYNIDSIIRPEASEVTPEVSLRNSEEIILTESSRPVRRNAKKYLQYDEGSDEDPFANVESSDDEPQKRKKGGRYNSDDEYFPGKMRPRSETESDSEIGSDLNKTKSYKRGRSKKADSVSQKSPKKRNKKKESIDLNNTSQLQDNVDFELTLETSVIKLNDDKASNQHEFENFLAKMTEIKVKKAKSLGSEKTPFEIPTIDPTKEKKIVEVGSQTNPVKATTIAVQTNTLYEVPMKNQVPLSEEQSIKAVEFLSNTVKTTSELGLLMTQKSDDFIKKRINAKYVTDTFKMDYCVKKSFLLLKLAKHNLVQMEEDLAKQYEEFLKANNLIQHREEQNVIIATTSKAQSSDSDCEIVEETVVKKPKEKPAFNPKTVFLNKELSIKIAKKSPTIPKPKEKLNVKGRHTVWINDSIMVKKIKPTQSFLAQDSRNKKPPDTYVTQEMVSDFFKMYEHQKAISICAPHIETNWFQSEKLYICNYFIQKSSDFTETAHVTQREDILSEDSFTESEQNNVDDTKISSEPTITCPKTLSSMCIQVINQYLHFKQTITKNACSYRMSVDNNDNNNVQKNIKYQEQDFFQVHSLKTLCCKTIKKLIHVPNFSENETKLAISDNSNPTSSHVSKMDISGNSFIDVSSLRKVSLRTVQNNSSSYNYISGYPKEVIYHNASSLKHIALERVKHIICTKKFSHQENNEKKNNNNIKRLSDICTNLISTIFTEVNDNDLKQIICTNTMSHLGKNEKSNCNAIKSLSEICTNFISMIFAEANGNDLKSHLDKNEKSNYNAVKKLSEICTNFISMIFTKANGNDINSSFCTNKMSHLDKNEKRNYNAVKRLSEICINFISMIFTEPYENGLCKENALQKTKFCPTMSLKNVCFNKVTSLMKMHGESPITDVDTSLNFTIGNVNTISEDIFLEGSENNFENINGNELYTDDEHNFSDNDFELPYEGTEDEENNWVSQVQMQELRSCVDPMNLIDSEKYQETLPADCLVNIKVEPHEDITENAIDSSTVKIEPEDETETMITPVDVITKQEYVIPTTTEFLRKERSNSYDVDAFEAFVSSNKMIQSMVNSENEDVFSQSALRVRMQHEPDLNEDIDTLTDTMNLLIPQNIELAKDRLMESSSDEDASKKTGKVKVTKRRGRPKKGKHVVEPTKEKAPTKNEVTILTRKMRGRIRLEEKKKDSSESELEDVILKQVKEKDILKTNNEKHGKDTVSEQSEKEIQCNDVDSTENINENMPNMSKKELRKKQNKSSAESNKIIHNESRDLECKQSTSSNDGLGVSSLIAADEPVELLQCTPSILSLDNCFIDNESITENTSDTAESNEAITYVERYGWKCYPINNKDTKIYQYATVFLDKLPESFVKTYFKYQDVTERSQIDTEIAKLTNLQTLHRTQSKEKGRGKIKEGRHINKSNSADVDLDNNLEAEHCNELSPSEDEANNIDEDDLPLIAPQHSSENSLAKNILMNDDESDREDIEPKIKEERDDNLKTHSLKQKDHLENNGTEKEDLMLTADKMMNKELALLHAPVELNDDIKDVKDIDSKPSRSCHKNSTRSHGVKEKLKDDDDSSSEEEKQWFTTKEKLLKRLEKKQDTPSVDDAKRTKIVNEFIEKRSDSMEIRRSTRPRARRSNKKMLERRKQMKILSRELFGDESTHTGKKSQSQTYSKGRRNIRKVIDKKLLARETVLANMEEFERKRRLTQIQVKLREELGCEEGVNVVVINGELCLEYDFEQMCPVVTVHPFFTKVMKAHQYEGVKFMWDACFESVSQVSRGNKGGGCILAHCMGLGKTLQVLALLHTVLTHPHVGMRRVLVCCPLSTVLNWVDEINKWIGPVTEKIKVFELSKLKKTYERAYQLEDWYNGGGIFIIGYELFRSLTTLDPVIDCVRPTIINKIRKALLDPGPDIIICDEGHLLKNDCSILAVAMSRVVTKRRIILTGTPMQNNLREYYCMVNFVKPNLLGTYAEYSNRFENPIMNGQHRDSREEDTKLMKARSHILHKVLEGCLQRQEASVLYPYLPKKHEYTVFITLTKCQWDLYKHYLLNYAKASKQNVLKDFHVLQKIWTHPQVLHNFFLKSREDDKQSKIKVEKLEDDLAHEDLAASEDIKPNAMETWWLQYVADTGSLDSLQSSNKFLVIFRLLDECTALGDKVLIFSTSLYTMDALEYFLRRINNWSLGKDYYRLDGSVPAEVRQKWCREFNAPNNTTTKLFLISTRAGSLGLNMTAANRVIILDTSWNPAHDIQSIFRVYRFGQKKDCYIYRLVAMGTMEQKIYERSVTKQAVACRVVDEQQIDRHYNMSELSELYRFDDDDFGVSAGLAPGVHDAALLRVAHGLSVESEESKDVVLHAVHEHDSLLRGSGETNLPEHERAAAWMQFQQEHHTHNNIENIAIKPKKEKKENKTKTDTQKIKQETIEEQEKRYEYRSKKGRKGVNANNSIEQPSTSEQIDPQTHINMEQDIIRKIMSILIKHGFHLSNGPEEISQLVANVRNVVTNFKTNGLNTDDPLVESIARVLLTGENTTDLPDPTNFIVPEQTILGTTLLDENAHTADKIVNEGSEMLLERKRRKQRPDSDEEYVPETMRRKKGNDKSSKRKSHESVLPVDNWVDIEIDNSTLNGSLHSSYMQTTPDMPYEPQASTSKQMDITGPTELTKAIKVEPKSKKETKTKKKFNKSKQESVQESITVRDIRNMVDKCNYDEDSIVLSDDDEPLVATARPSENTSPESTSIDYSSPNNIVTSPPAPPVPLHKSLLTNQNFIKIVAHTYLTGNPKLDVDAAILAAQYSTLKALKEMKATKKDIVSGPLYDIAKKVLGTALLEKLQNVHTNKKDTADIINESSTSFAKKNMHSTIPVPDNIQLNKASSNIAKTAKVESKVQKKKSMPKNKKHLAPSAQNIMISDDLPQTIQVNEVVSLTSSPSSSPNVVPVGMFKGSASIPTNAPPATEECILPDDDDDIIVTNDYIPNPPINPERLRSQQHLVTSISSNTKSSHNKIVRSLEKAESILPNTDPSRSVNPQQLPTNIATSQPKFINLVLPQSLLPMVKQNLVPVDNNNPDDTICLDSDDEVIPVPDKLKPVPKAVKSTTKLPYSIPNTSTSSEVPSSKQPKLKNDLLKQKAPTSKTITKISHGTGESISGLSDPEALSKVRKAASKNTNDIIRITESGKIEVLRRFVSPEVPANTVSDITDLTATEEFITGDLNISRTQQKCDAKIHPCVKSQEVVQKIDKSSKGPSQKMTHNLGRDSTEKKIGKSHGADTKSQKSDPLSVLQNVVQIPADKYDLTTDLPMTREINTKNVHSVPKRIIEKSPLIKPTTTKQSLTAVNKSKNTDTMAKLSNIPGLVSTNLGKFENTAQPGPSKSMERVTPVQTKKHPKKNEWDKVSGTTKDIVINKAGTLLKVKSKRDSPIDLTNVTDNASTSSSLKRPASWQDPSSKKKKQDTKKPLTLKDFNLDDIDDIIELE